METIEQEKKYEDDAMKKIQDAADAGLALLHGVINDNSEEMKTRLDAAKWAVEKARKKDSVDSEKLSLASFMEVLKDLKIKGEVIENGDSSTTIDAEHKDPENRFASWLDTNL